MEQMCSILSATQKMKKVTAGTMSKQCTQKSEIRCTRQTRRQWAVQTLDRAGLCHESGFYPLRGRAAATIQSRPGVNGYEFGKSSPSQYPGTAAGSCEPTTQSPTSRSGMLARKTRTLGLSDEKRSSHPMTTSRSATGRVGGQGTGSARSGSKDTRAAGSRLSHTTPT
jgi:hypothetical protein